MNDVTDFNPRSPCGERPAASSGKGEGQRISIHAPRAGSDIAHKSKFVNTKSISIHAPRAGSDAGTKNLPQIGHEHFNPRSPCGERLHQGNRRGFIACISIHAPRAGSDDVFPTISRVALQFQSTLPVRGATRQKYFIFAVKKFQSTLPVRGATGVAKLVEKGSQNFNPRSPCGERPPFLSE